MELPTLILGPVERRLGGRSAVKKTPVAVAKPVQIPGRRTCVVRHALSIGALIYRWPKVSPLTSKGPEVPSGQQLAPEIRWPNSRWVNGSVIAMLLAILGTYIAHYELPLLERLVGTMLSNVAVEWNLE